MMKKLVNGWIIVVLLVSCASMVAAYQPAENQSADISVPDALEKILSRGTLVVALNPDDEPLDLNNTSSVRKPDTKCTDLQYTEGEVSGFNVDLTNGIARELGVDSCFVIPDREELESEKWGEKWDYYPNYFITSERLDTYYFTHPVMSAPYVYFISSDNGNITNHEDLSGKIIATTYAYSVLSGYLNNNLSFIGNTQENQVKNATLILYDDELLAFDDLVAGKVDAMLVIEGQGNEAIENGTPIKPLMPYTFSGYGGLAIEKDASTDKEGFVKRLNEIIQSMHENGELSSISMKHTETDITKDAASFDIASLNQFNESSA
jgi:ABC-type amino acid transport substrate-binding protein